jgi:hypothetical protein
METEEKLNDMAMGMAVQVVTIAGTLNNELHSELQKLSNIPQDSSAVNSTFYDIVFFGFFIFCRKNYHLRFPEERERIDPILKKNLIFAMATVGYGGYGNDLTGGAIEKFQQSLETSGWYDNNMKEYLDYRGDTALLLEEKLMLFFNGKYKKIVFLPDSSIAEMQKNLIKRSKSILPWKRLSVEEGHEVQKEFFKKLGNEVILSENFLFQMAKAISEEFEKTELVTL